MSLLSVSGGPVNKGCYLAVLGWLCSTMLANAQPLVKVAYIDFPPYGYTDEEGYAAGIFNDFTRHVLAIAGYETEFQELPRPRMYKQVQQGSTHILVGTKSLTSIADVAEFSSSSIGQVHVYAYFLAGLPAPESHQSLNHHHVVTISGYTYDGLHTYLQDPVNQIQTTKVFSHKSGLKMLEHGRADYLLDYLAPVSSYLQQYGRPDNLRQKYLRSSDVYLMYSKLAPQMPELQQRVDAAIEELRQLPYYKDYFLRTLEKYGSPEY